MISNKVCGAVYGGLADGVGCVDGPASCNVSTDGILFLKYSSI